MAVFVKPESFEQVDFDPSVIARIATVVGERACPGVLSDSDVIVDIDENAPTSRAHVVSLNPITFDIESGALERYSRPRTLGDSEAELTLARLFLEVGDRRSDEFGAPSMETELSHAHRVAWNTNLYGRASRLGYQTHKPRYRYDFRNRHGFSAPVDGIFEQLWSGDDLTFADIVGLSDTAVAPVVASRPRLADGTSQG